MMRNLLATVAGAVGAPPPDDPAERPWPASCTHARFRLTPADARVLHERVQAVITAFEDAPPVPGAIEYDMIWIHAARAASPDAVDSGGSREQGSAPRS